MHLPSKGSKKAKRFSLVIDDTLQKRSTDSPQFEAKIEKATQIMALVRAKQSEEQHT